ncbi:MAG TPA: type I DNA topoisomerase [Firmicutes bacterium]|nr:type I DNA topoisomerase [Bacillota bacterium]
MAKSLVIVESPAKAKTIKKFLSNRYQVHASMGHVRDLPRSQFGVDIEKGFEPKYITIRGKGPVLQELRQMAKRAPKVYLASDPDREGEAIAWHLSEALGIKPSERCRIEFNEITKEAVQKAIKKPRPIDLNRVNAQQARRILDRLVGYKLSPLLWQKVKKGLSAGRVQSVAVRLICDREREIAAFVPEEYWSLSALLQEPEAEDTFRAKFYGTVEEKVPLKNEAETRRLVTELKGSTFGVVGITRKERKKNPPRPFTTSSLQQEAARKLGFSVKKTMVLAQQLYEGLDLGKEGTVGLVTYIRTDSTRVSELARQQAKAYIEKELGPRYWAGQKTVPGKTGRVQDAHEAIRPTSVERTPEAVRLFLKPDQYKLYRLIWQRFVASQMAPVQYNTVSADIKGGNYLFRATGSTLVFPGFLKVYDDSKDNNQEEEEGLPELVEGQELKLLELEPKQHFTQPPPRYSEASLVKTLEEQGIGRPSTYAPIVSTILQRGYVTMEERRFVPTELGFIVTDLLTEFFPEIIDVEFTANLENYLDSIEEGKVDWRQVIDYFYRPFAAELDVAREKIEEVTIEEEVTDEICEVCGRNLVVKTGRYGKFLACPGFPECRFTKPILEEIGVKCPRCGRELVVRQGKKGRGRKFYGCSNYPDCDFVLWDKPVARQCPKCQSLLVEKSTRGKELYYKCSNKDCDYKESPRESGREGG